MENNSEDILKRNPKIEKRKKKKEKRKKKKTRTVYTKMEFQNMLVVISLQKNTYTEYMLKKRNNV